MGVGAMLKFPIQGNGLKCMTEGPTGDATTCGTGAYIGKLHAIFLDGFFSIIDPETRSLGDLQKAIVDRVEG